MSIVNNTYILAPIIMGIAILVGGLIGFGRMVAGKGTGGDILKFAVIGGLAGIVLIAMADMFIKSPDIARDNADFLSTFVGGDICDKLPEIFCQSPPAPTPP